MLAWRRSGISFAALGALALRVGLEGPAARVGAGIAMAVTLALAGIGTNAAGAAMYRGEAPWGARRRVVRAVSVLTLMTAIGALGLAVGAPRP